MSNVWSWPGFSIDDVFVLALRSDTEKKSLKFDLNKIEKNVFYNYLKFIRLFLHDSMFRLKLD